jgi:hypothetical protein
MSRHCVAAIEQFSKAVVVCGSSRVRRLGQVSGENGASQRRKLQRWIKSGWKLETFFVAWIKQVVRLFALTELTLIVDETKIQDRFGIMMVGVAYKQRTIPLVWRVYLANNAEGRAVKYKRDKMEG